MVIAALEDIQLLDWLICGAYLAFVVGLGVYFSGTEDSNDEFFHGGKSMHRFLSGYLSLQQPLVPIHLLAYPQKARLGTTTSYSQFFLYHLWSFPSPASGSYQCTNPGDTVVSTSILNAGLIAGCVFWQVPSLCFTQRDGWRPCYWPFSRVLGEVLEAPSPETGCLIIGVVGILATIYTAMGGVKAVIWTDTIQAFALGGGMLFLLVALIGDIDGGWATYFEVAENANKMDMTSTSGGWGERNVFSAIAYGFFIYMGGQVATCGAYRQHHC